jgi:hypothetical protein
MKSIDPDKDHLRQTIPIPPCKALKTGAASFYGNSCFTKLPPRFFL